jgi:hypothetical protein
MSAGRFERKVSEEQVTEIVAKRILGESLRAISEAVGVPRSTVAGLLKAPDVVALIEAEKANERKEHEREGNRVRQAKKRERDTRAALGVAPDSNPHTPIAERPTIAAQRRRGSADGRILGFVSGALQDGAQVTVYNDHLRSDVTYETWLDTPREPLPGSTLARIEYVGAETEGTLSLDVIDAADLRRVADILISEGIGTEPERNDLITTLSRVRAGAHVVLRYEEPDEEDEDEDE